MMCPSCGSGPMKNVSDSGTNVKKMECPNCGFTTEERKKGFESLANSLLTSMKDLTEDDVAGTDMGTGAGGDTNDLGQVPGIPLDLISVGTNAKDRKEVNYKCNKCDWVGAGNLLDDGQCPKCKGGVSEIQGTQMEPNKGQGESKTNESKVEDYEKELADLKTQAAKIEAEIVDRRGHENEYGDQQDELDVIKDEIKTTEQAIKLEKEKANPKTESKKNEDSGYDTKKRDIENARDHELEDVYDDDGKITDSAKRYEILSRYQKQLDDLKNSKTTESKQNEELRPFIKKHWYGLAGAEKFNDGSDPMIHSDKDLVVTVSGPIGTVQVMDGDGDVFSKDFASKETAMNFARNLITGGRYQNFITMGMEKIMGESKIQKQPTLAGRMFESYAAPITPDNDPYKRGMV